MCVFSRMLLHFLFLHLLRNLGIVLLEALADALLRGHPLEDAAVKTAGLLGGEGLGGEVVDAGGEAVLDEAAESLYDIPRWQSISRWGLPL